MSYLELVKTILIVVAAVTAVWMYIRLTVNLRRFKEYDSKTPYLSLEEAPTLSVCIPVRNEDHAIRDCLERVLASNYPKMEVIVLDDESVDDTTEIVKIFARSGVRFIKGGILPESWIGKNKAGDVMLKQASGDFVLFMSADTDVKPDSFARLIDYALQEKVDMISVMPVRFDGQRLSAIFASLRYFWTILFATSSRPAYTSAAWLVSRRSLLDNGGFEKYKSVIIPELKIASDFSYNDKHRFLVSGQTLGFSYEKRWSSQLETAVRTLWPVNVRSGFRVFFILFLQFVMWFFMLLSIFGKTWSVLDWSILAISLLFNLNYLRFALVAWNKTSVLAFVVWPFVVIQEFLCLVFSAWRHQTNSVVWKGRSLTDHID